MATLAQAGQILPNPTVLIHAVPILEAQASSEIENIVTTADELFKHADSEGGDPATKEALRYRSALFAAEDDLDPLVRMALAHYQFEAIHPFHDDNGRTGRVLNILMLIEAGLLDEPILYLSRAIIARKNDYYRLLRAVTAQDAWIDWILYMLDIVRESAQATVVQIGSIRNCQNTIADRARAATPGGRDARFLDVLFEQPYCRINTVAERCEVSRQTASTWLHSLVAAGLFSEVRGGRELLFVNHEFLEVLTGTGSALG